MKNSLILGCLFVFLVPITGFCQDTIDLCNRATMAKAKDNVCEAVQLYHQAKSAGYPNDTCQRHGDNYIAAHAGECDNTPKITIKKEHLQPEPYEEDKTKTKSGNASKVLCDQATMAKAKDNVCEAVQLYQQAKSAGYPDDTCKKHGDIYIAAHTQECANSPAIKIKVEHLQPEPYEEETQSGVDPNELCAQATMAKAKDNVCEAYILYRKAKSIGYPTDKCKKHGDNFIASHAAQCADSATPSAEEIDRMLKSSRISRHIDTNFCTYATMAIERNKVCKAYKYYKNVVNNILAYDEKCKKDAEKYVAAHETECKEVIENERKNVKTLSTKYYTVGKRLCNEAMTLKKSGQICDAYVFYKKLEDLKLDDMAVHCRTAAKTFIEKHAKECTNPTKEQTKLVQIVATNLCNEAKEHESSNGISAYGEYGAVELLGYPNNSCKKQAESYISAHPEKQAEIGSGPSDTDLLCFKAMIAAKDGDNITAYNSFSMAQRNGYPDEDCQKQGDEYLATHKKTSSNSRNAAKSAEREQRRAERQAQPEINRQKRAQAAEEWKQALAEMDPDERREALEERKAMAEQRRAEAAEKRNQALANRMQAAEAKGQKKAAKEEARSLPAYKVPDYKKMNEKALCQEAVNARENKSVCGAYEIYEYALDKGIKDLKCQQNAKKYVQVHRAECAN